MKWYKDPNLDLVKHDIQNRQKHTFIIFINLSSVYKTFSQNWGSQHIIDDKINTFCELYTSAMGTSPFNYPMYHSLSINSSHVTPSHRVLVPTFVDTPWPLEAVTVLPSPATWGQKVPGHRDLQRHLGVVFPTKLEEPNATFSLNQLGKLTSIQGSESEEWTMIWYVKGTSPKNIHLQMVPSQAFSRSFFLLSS